MNMRFHPSLKIVEEAYNIRNPKLLKKKWNLSSEDIIDALDVVRTSISLLDLSRVAWLNPHQMYKDNKHDYERYSLSPSGKRNSLRITLVCCTCDWIILDEVDNSTTYVLIREVGIHYGD